MKVIILGASGMLGQALTREANNRNIETIGLDIREADIMVDIRDGNLLEHTLSKFKPDIVVNTVAITNLDYCEDHPDQAYLTNSRPLAILAPFCAQRDIYLVHVSTDHFYTGHGARKHGEQDAVTLLNEYARSKFAAENFALTNGTALVLRTNIVGFKATPNETFAGWVFKALENGEPMVLFDDFYTSSLVVTQFARILFDLLPYRSRGLLNLSSQDVVSKKDFIMAVAEQAAYSLDNTRTGSVLALNPPRAESLGLDVKRIEGILGYAMPSLSEVVDELILEHRRINSEIR